MKFINDLIGNYHFVQHIESVGVVDAKNDPVFYYYIVILMTSGKEHIIGEYTTYNEAHSMLESIAEEISQ